MAAIILPTEPIGSIPRPPQLIDARHRWEQPTASHGKPYRIVWRMHQILFGAHIALRRLHGRVPEQHLNLFEFETGGAAQLCCCSA